MDFGQRLRSLRAKANMTQAELAQKLDVSRPAVGSWESGKIRPRLDKLSQIAELFGITVSELMGEPAGQERSVRGTSALVPLLGWAHMGEPVDEGELHEVVEVPAEVAAAHPRAFCVHAQGDCMDNLYPTDAILLVDPDMEPVSGCAVLAETVDHGAVVRLYMRGTSTVMLTASSHSGSYPDIIAGPDDDPIACRGRVVWYMRDHDDR